MDNGESLSVYLDNLKIIKEGEEYIIPLSDISLVVLDGMRTNISTRLLARCADYNVVLVTCDKKHLPVGMYLPYNRHSRSVKMLRNQINWTKEKKMKLWMEIVKYKLYNQGLVLYKFSKNLEAWDKINNYISEVQIGDVSNREAHGAKVYFNTIFGNQFNRRLDNIENAMLNYGYAVLRAYVARVIVSYGYNPSLGIFHSNEYNPYCLADDFMEIFRPIIDYYSLEYILSYHKEPVFLTQSIRAYLVSILDKKIYYREKKLKISTAIDKFVLNAIGYLEDRYSSIYNYEFKDD